MGEQQVALQSLKVATERSEGGRQRRRVSAGREIVVQEMPSVVGADVGRLI